LNATAVTPSKLVPVMVTAAPTAPVVGVNLVTMGAGTEKLVVDVPVPTAVVTLRGPVVAPAGTVTLIDVAVLVTMVAGTPLNVTAVALPRLTPVMVTLLPTAPEVGVKLVITGGPITVKLMALIPTPLAAVTEMGPVLAPAGTVAMIDVAETTLNEVAGVLLNATAVTPSRLVPLMVTVVPTAPVVGVNLVTVGAGTVKLVLEVVIPAAVVTVRGPVVAPVGTVALMAVAVLVTIVAGTPLKVTARAFARLAPVMVILLPTAPEVGVKLVMVGMAVMLGVHLAYSVVSPRSGVAKLNAVSRPLSAYQPAKRYPVLVGLAGRVAVPP